MERVGKRVTYLQKAVNFNMSPAIMHTGIMDAMTFYMRIAYNYSE